MNLYIIAAIWLYTLVGAFLAGMLLEEDFDSEGWTPGRRAAFTVTCTLFGPLLWLYQVAQHGAQKLAGWIDYHTTVSSYFKFYFRNGYRNLDRNFLRMLNAGIPKLKGLRKVTVAFLQKRINKVNNYVYVERYSEEVRASAKATADWFRKHGWCGYDAWGPNGEGCAVVGMVAALHPSTGKYDNLLAAAKNEAGAHDIVKWNEAPGRTQEEVIALFDRIATQ